MQGWISTRAEYSCVALALIAAGATISPLHAADFYAGKTIEIVVGSGAGGGFDIYARAIARHWGKRIPGSPTFVVKNMPGGGGTRAGAYISTVAPKDGTVIAAPSPGAVMGPLLDEKAPADFDPTKAIYIGTIDHGVRVCVTYASSKVKTAEDAATLPAMIGASAPGGSSSDYAHLHRNTSGARFNVVSGYQGMTDASLAIERGELDGACGWDWSSLKSMKPNWLKEKKINILFQVGLQSDPELDALGVPEIWKFVKTDEDRKVVELIASQQVFMRFFIAPPGTPPDRISILRRSFDETVASPEFLADAEKQQLSVKPMSGERISEVVAKIYATPKDIVERARRAIRP